jgi:hypothetical protein
MCTKPLQIEGAGGEEDFTDSNAFQKHVRKINNRQKRKRS